MLGFFFLDPTVDHETINDARASSATLLRRRLKAIAEERGSEAVLGRATALQRDLARLEEAETKRMAAFTQVTGASRPEKDPLVLVKPRDWGRTEGKKLLPLPLHDVRRVGVGSGGVDPSSALAIDPQMQFVSTNASAFTPFLLDQTSNTIYRAVTSDTDAEEAARRRVRDARQARTQHNLDTSKAYRELEDLNRAMVHLKRNERKTDSMLQYESRMFLEDLRLREKQPLNRMSKRPNTVASLAMWKGTVGSYFEENTESANN